MNAKKYAFTCAEYPFSAEMCHTAQLAVPNAQLEVLSERPRPRGLEEPLKAVVGLQRLEIGAMHCQVQLAIAGLHTLQDVQSACTVTNGDEPERHEGGIGRRNTTDGFQPASHRSKPGARRGGIVRGHVNQRRNRLPGDFCAEPSSGLRIDPGWSNFTAPDLAIERSSYARGRRGFIDSARSSARQLDVGALIELELSEIDQRRVLFGRQLQ